MSTSEPEMVTITRAEHERLLRESELALHYGNIVWKVWPEYGLNPLAPDAAQKLIDTLDKLRQPAIKRASHHVMVEDAQHQAGQKKSQHSLDKRKQVEARLIELVQAEIDAGNKPKLTLLFEDATLFDGTTLVSNTGYKAEIIRNVKVKFNL